MLDNHLLNFACVNIFTPTDATILGSIHEDKITLFILLFDFARRQTVSLLSLSSDVGTTSIGLYQQIRKPDNLSPSSYQFSFPQLALVREHFLAILLLTRQERNAVFAYPFGHHIQRDITPII